MNLWRDPGARLILIANFLLVVGSGITWIAVPWLLIHQPNGEALFGVSTSVLTLLILLLLPYLGKVISLGSLGASVYYPAQFAFNQEVLAREQYSALS